MRKVTLQVIQFCRLNNSTWLNQLPVSTDVFYESLEQQKYKDARKTAIFDFIPASFAHATQPAPDGILNCTAVELGISPSSSTVKKALGFVAKVVLKVAESFLLFFAVLTFADIVETVPSNTQCACVRDQPVSFLFHKESGGKSFNLTCQNCSARISHI
jgi:hypothetical protein